MSAEATRGVHGEPGSRAPHGALRPPLYDSVAFEFESSAELEKAFAGRRAAHVYSRITNPTVQELEQRMRLLSGGFGVLAVASGMAAITACVLTLAHAGSNIVTTRRLFGNTLSLFVQTLARWGLETRFADMANPARLGEQIDKNTALVFLESISNPQLEVADLEAVVAVAAAAGVPVVLDGTLTTPLMLNSKAAGVAIEVISTTKHISGGATSVGGLIIDNGTFDWRQAPALTEMAQRVGPAALLARLRTEVYRNTGGCLAPHNAWLQILGLETLALRIDASSKNALAVARFLQSATEVSGVNYPGLEQSPWHTVAARQFRRGFGSLLTFELADKVRCFAFMDRLALIRKATNICDNKSLIIHPASTIFAEFGEQQRAEMGISEGLLRLSVGIEDTIDILEDIQRALEVV
jgi:O-acetylhomoserine (thiol)-lyase